MLNYQRVPHISGLKWCASAAAVQGTQVTKAPPWGLDPNVMERFKQQTYGFNMTYLMI